MSNSFMQLLLFDTAGIQPYVFRSNKLRENVCASYLVAQATGQWVTGGTIHTVGSGNVILADDTTTTIESDPSRQAEIVYAAGGNALVITRDEAVAQKFVKHLSERILTEAPGLRLIVAQRSFDFANHSLPTRIRELFSELARQKREDPPSEPLLGLAVTRACHSTGFPAVGLRPKLGEDPAVHASAEILAKHTVLYDANNTLSKTFPLPRIAATTDTEGRVSSTVVSNGETPTTGSVVFELAFPTELDHLGRSHDKTSLIAVVHADGDGMGQKFQEVGNEYLDANNGDHARKNREYIKAFRKLSKNANKISTAALQKSLDTLCNSIKVEKNNKGTYCLYIERWNSGNQIQRLNLKSKPPQKDEPPTYYLPVRPIVFGGDDLTLVCDGRLGLSLTTHYIDAFACKAAELARTEKLDLKDVTSSAGVALVKTHYPFARAYELSERLCKSAKDYRKNNDKKVGCLDWHLSRTTLYDSLNAMRSREFTARNGSLTMRPVSVDNDKRSWKTVSEGIKEFQAEVWHTKRNKLKRLVEVLRDGDTETERFLNAIDEELPALSAFVTGSHRSNGWAGTYCPYFDALELADLHIALPDHPCPDSPPETNEPADS